MFTHQQLRRCALGICLFSAFAWGNPVDPSVLAGTASFDTSTVDSLIVTASDRSIIAWDQFSISPSEKTHFELPDATAVVLNRVISFEPSRIEGLLSGNGTIYLVNPSGILIGPSGKVDAAGFLASTLDLSDEDFLGGTLLFEGTSTAQVENEGEILAREGNAALISYRVRNSGQIDAPNGAVDLAAGVKVLLTLGEDKHIQILASVPDGVVSEYGIDQRGVIEAHLVELRADGHLYECAINQTGAVSATEIETHAGRVLLLAEGGQVKNKGEIVALGEHGNGGVVEVLGDTVIMEEDARVNASGKTGGGIIHVGGSFQGRDPSVLSATNTMVQRRVSITADAIENGHGGEVVVWAENITGFHGEITARGGEFGGDGGMVEVSGIQCLDYQGMTNTLAPQGKTGTLLLDPTAVTIVAAPGPDTNNTYVAPNYSFTAAASNINVGTVSPATGLLGNLTTSSVNINSTSGSAGTGAITFATAFTWTGTNTNTLTVTSTNGATSPITISAAITNSTTAGNISLVSSGNISIGASISNASTSSSTISLTAGTTITFVATPLTIATSNAGSISMSATTTLTSNAANTTFSFAGTGSATFSGTAVTLNSVAGISYNSSGLFQITSTAGAISVPPTITFGAASGPQVNIAATGGSTTIVTAGTIASGSATTFTLSGTSVAATGTLNYGSSGAINITSSTTTITTPTITYSATTGPQVNIAATTTVTTATAGTITGTNTYTLSGTAITQTGTLAYNSTGNFSATGSGAVSVATVTFGAATGPQVSVTTTGGAVSMAVAGTINGSNTFNVKGTTTSATSLTGTLAYNSTGAFEVSLNSGVAANLTVPAAVTFGGAAPGTVTIKTAGTGGTVTANGPLTFSGTVGPQVIITTAGANAISSTLNGTINGTTTFNIAASATSATILSGTLAFNSSGTFNVSTSAGNLTIPGALTFGGTSPGAVSITAAGTVTVTANPLTFAASVSGPSVNITGTTLTVATAGTIPGSSTYNISGAGVTQTGTLAYNSSGDFTITGTAAVAVSTVTFGAAAGPLVSITATGALSTTLNGTITGIKTFTMSTGATSANFFNGSLTYNSTGAFTMTATAGNMTVNGTLNYNSITANTLTIQNTGAGSILFNTTSVLTFGSGAGPVLFQTTGGGNITFSSTTPVTFSAPAAGSGTFTVTSTGTIPFNSNLDYSYPGTMQLTSTGAITSNASATAWNFRNGSGNVNINSGLTVTINAATVATFDAGAGNFSVTTPAASALAYNGPIVFNSVTGKTVTLNAGAALTVGSITYNSNGNCTLTGGTSLTTTAATTIHFLPGGTGNLLMTATAAAIAMNGALVFDSGSGGVTMLASTNITMTGSTTYASANLFTMTATTGAIATTAATGSITFSGAGGLTMTANTTFTNNGTITFSPGATGGLTINANQLLTVGATGTITYASTAPISLTSTLSSITVNGAMNLATVGTGVLTLTANSASPNGNLNINNAIRNTGSGPINASCGNNLTVGTGAQVIPCQIGSAGGDVTFTNVGSNVFLTGGAAANAFAQIGFDAGNVSSNIIFSQIGADLLLNGGTANTCYVVIGHGSALSTGSGGTRSGNISFGSALAPIPGFIAVQGSSLPVTNVNGAGSFSQIGHVRSPATSPAIITGNVDLRFVTNSITILGGNRTGTYALIGHGGATSGQADSYTGSVRVNTSLAGSTVTILGGTQADAFAGVGHGALFNGAGTVTMSSSLIEVISGDGISVKTGDNAEAFIGAYIKATGGGSGNINVTNINVTSGGNDLEVIGAAPSEAFNAVLIGALSYTGVMPLVAAGTAASNVTINVGGAFVLQVGSESAGTDVFALVQNGVGSPAGGPFSTSVTTTLNVELYGGNNVSAINSLGPLTINAGGGVILFSDHNPGSAGSAAITANGTTSITADFLELSAGITGPITSISNSTGNMTFNVLGDITLDANSIIRLTGGSGTLAMTMGTDLLVVNNSAIQNIGSGSTNMTIGSNVMLYGGAGNASIATLGPLTMTLTDNLNLSTNPGGSGFITAGGTLNITATNIFLGGLATGLQSIISTSSGDMLIIADNNIEVNDNATILNTGAGQLTIVVDNQAPTSPAIGAGRFTLAPDAIVSTASASNLRIYCARTNGIGAGNLAFGQANGNFVTLGLACAFDAPPPSATAIYDVYYPTDSAIFGVPYTFFFKSVGSGPNPPAPPTPADLVPFLPSLLIGSSELFTDLKEMEEECNCKKAALRNYIYPMCGSCSQTQEWPSILIQKP